MYEYEVFYNPKWSWQAIHRGYKLLALFLGHLYAIVNFQWNFFALVFFGPLVSAIAIQFLFSPLSTPENIASLFLATFLFNHIYAQKCNADRIKRNQPYLVASNVLGGFESDAINKVLGDRRGMIISEFKNLYGRKPSKQEIDFGMWSGMFLEPRDKR